MNSAASMPAPSGWLVKEGRIPPWSCNPSIPICSSGGTAPQESKQLEPIPGLAEEVHANDRATQCAYVRELTIPKRSSPFPGASDWSAGT